MQSKRDRGMVALKSARILVFELVSSWICLPLCLFQCHLPTRTLTHIYTHTHFASMPQLPLVAQQGTVKLSSVPFLYCAALSCRISLLTQSCHGLQGLKMAMRRSKKWNSGNKPFIYFSACMLMSACIYIYVHVFVGASMGGA